MTYPDNLVSTRVDDRRFAALQKIQRERGYDYMTVLVEEALDRLLVLEGELGGHEVINRRGGLPPGTTPILSYPGRATSRTK